MHTLDTNTIIYYLEGEHGVGDFLEELLAQNSATYISVMTELELFSHALLTADDMHTIERIISSLTIIPLDSRVARTAAALRRQHHIKSADSAIAATALLTGTTLVTRNISDFKTIPGLKLFEI